MNSDNGPIASIAVKGLQHSIGDHTLSADICVGLPLSTITRESIPVVQRDFEILAEKLRTNPEEVSVMMNALVSGKIREGLEWSEKIGLTEDDLKAAGGGLLWLAVAVGVAVFLYAKDAF